MALACGGGVEAGSCRRLLVPIPGG